MHNYRFRLSESQLEIIPKLNLPSSSISSIKTVEDLYNVCTTPEVKNGLTIENWLDIEAVVLDIYLYYQNHWFIDDLIFYCKEIIKFTNDSFVGENNKGAREGKINKDARDHKKHRDVKDDKDAGDKNINDRADDKNIGDHENTKDHNNGKCRKGRFYHLRKSDPYIDRNRYYYDNLCLFLDTQDNSMIELFLDSNRIDPKIFFDVCFDHILKYLVHYTNTNRDVFYTMHRYLHRVSESGTFTNEWKNDKIARIERRYKLNCFRSSFAGKSPCLPYPNTFVDFIKYL